MSASQLITEAVFSAGLRRYDADGDPWRPTRLCYYFLNEAHRKLFQADPAKYEPQYGGFCSNGAPFGIKMGSDTLDTVGVIARSVAGIPRSGIREFFDIVQSQKDVISLGVGEPDFVTPWHIREAAIYALERGKTTYTSNLGLLKLREAIAAHLAPRFGVTYDPKKQILIAVGVSEALDIALRAIVNPGDKVIYHEPCYVSYGPSVSLAHGVPVAVSCRAEDNFAVRAEARRWSGCCDSRRMPRRSRTGLGMSEPQVKSPGPTKIHCRITPIAVLAPQYRPTPAGVAMTNHENTEWFKHGQDVAKAKELFAKAGYDGKPVVVLQATDHYLANPAGLFAAQWLRLQDLEKVRPDAFFFPDYDQQLADAMRELKSFEHKYRALQELADVFSAIRKTKRRLADAAD